MRSEYAPVMIPWFGVHYYKLNNRNNARISSSSSNSNHCNNNNNVSDNFTRGRSNMRPQLNISSSCTKSRVTSARRTFHQVKEGKNVAQKLLFFTPGGLFLLLFVLVPLGTDALNCYQCYSNSLDPCSYEDYRPCPGLHNRCAIRTRRVHTGELFVKRECSLGCGDGIDTWSTRDLNFSYYCDTRRPDYECKVCCRGDGCNYSGSLGLPVPSVITVISLALAIACTWVKFQ